MTSIVGIVYSNELLQLSSLSPKYGNRFSLVMGLISAYDLFKYLTRIPPLQLSNSEEIQCLNTFHR